MEGSGAPVGVKAGRGPQMYVIVSGPDRRDSWRGSPAAARMLNPHDKVEALDDSRRSASDRSEALFHTGPVMDFKLDPNLMSLLMLQEVTAWIDEHCSSGAAPAFGENGLAHRIRDVRERRGRLGAGGWRPKISGGEDRTATAGYLRRHPCAQGRPTDGPVLSGALS